MDELHDRQGNLFYDGVGMRVDMLTLRLAGGTCADEGQQPPRHVRAAKHLASTSWCRSARALLLQARLSVGQEDRPLELHCHPTSDSESVGAGELPGSIKGEVDVSGRSTDTNSDTHWSNWVPG